jgi:hypothetical protein
MGSDYSAVMILLKYRNRSQYLKPFLLIWLVDRGKVQKLSFPDGRIMFLWYAQMYGLVDTCQRFGGICCFCLQSKQPTIGLHGIITFLFS